MIRLVKFLSYSIALLILISCNSDDDSNALYSKLDIASMDEIVDDSFVIQSFRQDGTARLPIKTQIPVACTVVYGETAEFGFLALDQDMSGRPHSEHNPLLTGLISGTTYLFRVQGVDENGTIYVSETMTFVVPSSGQTGDTDTNGYVATPTENPYDAGTELVENLTASGSGAHITGYSSAYGGAAHDELWGVDSALDGDPNTEWASEGDGSNAWIEITLPESAYISSISFRSRFMSDGTAVTNAFTLTLDGATVLGPFSVPDADGGHEFAIGENATRLRLNLTETTGGNTGIVDVAVFGQTVP